MCPDIQNDSLIVSTSTPQTFTNISEINLSKIEAMSNKDLLGHLTHLARSLEKHKIKYKNETFFNQKWELKKIMFKLSIEIDFVKAEIEKRKKYKLEKKLIKSLDLQNYKSNEENVTKELNNINQINKISLNREASLSLINSKKESILLGMSLLHNKNEAGEKVVKSAVKELEEILSNYNLEEDIAKTALEIIVKSLDFIKQK